MKLLRQRHEQHHKYATFDKAPTICCQEKPPKQIAKQSLAAEASAMQHLYMSVVVYIHCTSESISGYFQVMP